MSPLTDCLLCFCTCAASLTQDDTMQADDTDHYNPYVEQFTQPKFVRH